MSEAARCGLRVLYLGSRPGVAARGASILRSEFPNLEIATHHGYFEAETTGSDNLAVLASIDKFRPDVLMVGMGMPRQEHWIVDNLHKH